MERACDPERGGDAHCKSRAERERQKSNPREEIYARAQCGVKSKLCQTAAQALKERRELAKEAAERAIKEKEKVLEQRASLKILDSPKIISNWSKGQQRPLPLSRQYINSSIFPRSSKKRHDIYVQAPRRAPSQKRGLSALFTPGQKNVRSSFGGKKAATSPKPQKNNSENRILKETVQVLKAERQRLEGQLAACTTAHKQCQDKNGELNENNKNLDKENQKLVKEVNKYVLDAGAEKKKLDDEKEEARKLREKIDNAKLDLQRQNQENENLKLRIKGLLKDLEQERALLDREKARVEAEVARELDAARHTYEIDKQKLEAARRQIELQRDEIIRDLDRRDKEFNKVRDQLLRENEQYKANAEDIKRMRDELKQARAQVQQNVSCKRNIAQLEKSVKRSAKKTNVNAADVDKLKEQLKVERAKLRQLRAIMKKQGAAGKIEVNLKLPKGAKAKAAKAKKPKATKAKKK